MKLSTTERAAVLHCLLEGNSIASTTRITGAAKNTILDLLAAAGEACADYQDKHLRNLPCTTIQLDEQWSYVGCKEARKPKAKLDHQGDIWTWKCICADTKLIVGWHIGDRGQQSALDFCADLAPRFANRVQITTDGLAAYRFAIGVTFAPTGVDFAQLIKIYALRDGWEVCVGARKVRRRGDPDWKKISTSYAERQNLTTRMSNRRFARLTNAYSKKVENHCHMVAIGLMHYNFCRRHMTLKATPAQAALVTDHQWSIDEIVQMMDNYAKAKEEAAFERAFQMPHFTPKHRSYARTPTPKDQIPLPWYLDPNSGGPPETAT